MSLNEMTKQLIGALLALKGQYRVAQGDALGQRILPLEQSPEGAKQS
jgi:hypothetical protein